ncbi:MAG: tRNA (adenosine(37)-N6)-dimethylallyltransferase MiaA [Bacteroidales bacterium]|nr:tRNA (adenosine(37)-N6)-dimethylallyltransferase MiaA [Bacteroidales bacterium]MCF8327878.1 tRNA (adenosine(37)-N6)-dimethylallyltransferase MiaA [Bacteroidales bacterium]
MQKTHKTLIVITGPTASGKTDLSIDVARELGTEIISADSRQFYKEMKIGTAAPSQKQLDTVPHHFIGHLSIQDNYNVSRFEQDVLKKLDELFKHYDFVVLTGGSGLYIDAVCKGIDDMPDIPVHIREAVDENYSEFGIDYLRQYLQNHDPVYYEQVDKSNPNRMKRGVEVFEATGIPFSSFRKKENRERDFNIVKFGLLWERELLNERINQRTDLMMQKGLLDEVKALYPYRNCNALNTVGYKELFAFLDNKMSLNEAVEKIKTQTRRYAKRQMTWLRKDTSMRWVDVWDDPLEYILKNISSYG